MREGLGEPETCYLCGGSLNLGAAEVDHIVPKSKGGNTTISNLRWAHRSCNRIKHDLTVEDMKEQMRKILDHLG